MRKTIKSIIFFIISIIMSIVINSTLNVQFLAYEKSERKEALTTIKSEGEIVDGTYIIASSLNENYVLDISAASKSNGANVQLWSDANVEQQKFKITSVGDGYYKIQSVYSGKVVDVSGGIAKNANNVQQWSDAGVDAQKWKIKSDGNGSFYISSKLGGLCLNVAYGSAKDGANIEIYQNNKWASQKFKLKLCSDNSNTITGTKTLEDGTYQIKSALNENYVLDIAEASSANNANLQIWKNSATENQIFVVKYIGDGYYTITNKKSNKLLNLASSNSNTNNNVNQYQSNNSNKQKWIIREAGNGYYYIISSINNLSLNVQYGSAKNGTNIEAYALSNWTSQKFKFEEYKEEKITGTQTIDNGIYQIKSALNENYVLDIAEGSNQNNANVQLWKNANTLNQRFKVTYLGDGYYSITNSNSNKTLNLVTSGSSTGNNVNQYQPNGSDKQKWIIKEAGKGYYYIISSINKLSLNVQNGNAKNGTNIEAYALNSWTSQKFKFEKIDAKINIDTSKYPGYKEKIEQLMTAHPTWNFELLYTGINFNDAVAGEYSVRKRNLVPTSYGGEWIAGTELYDTGWYAASEKAIAYYMDPRNFLDDVNVFQFQDVNEYIDGVCTLEGIQDRVSNSFLKDYATDINTACKNTNVNPYYIIARLFQENGTNPTSGTHKMDGGDGKYYYNPFNIGASGDSKEEVYNNALARAKKEGWDTMTKALEGGIYFCKVNWLDNYQNTLYQNRFDIDTRNGTALYTHQYMQNLMGAYSEAKLLRTSYVNTNKIESNFTFIIPVYEGMDKTLSPMPADNTETYAINVKTTGTYINLRKDANTDSAVLRTISDKGTILLSVKRGVNSNWQQVVTQDGLIGYISGDYLEQVDDVKTCNYTAKVKTNDGQGCNTRIGPSTSLDKVRWADDGTVVTVIDDSTYKNVNGYDWIRIMFSDGAQAFIPSIYLTK